MNSDHETLLLMHQLRGANQRLVLATVRSHELAEQAEAAREQIVDSELRLRLLMNTIASIVWSADTKGRVHFEASPFLALSELEAGEGNHEWQWLDAVHPGDRERVRETWAAATRQGTPYLCEHRVRLRGGGVAWVQARAVEVPGSVSTRREWIGMMADIGDRKRVDEARERFIGVLGHDLRSPLNAIDMSNVLLQRLTLPEKAAPLVKAIARSSKRMTRMIADVLDFARGRLGGGIPVVRDDSDFGEICAGAIAEICAGNPERSIAFETVGELRGTWDAARIEQVIVNLVSNALHHGADPVRVSVQASADEVVLEVHNQNKDQPLPAVMLLTLFEPFQRGSTPGADGLGLGLFIVSEIVRAHQGTIVATSSAAGTTFTSRWPRHRA